MHNISTHNKTKWELKLKLCFQRTCFPDYTEKRSLQTYAVILPRLCECLFFCLYRRVLTIFLIERRYQKITETSKRNWIFKERLTWIKKDTFLYYERWWVHHSIVKDMKGKAEAGQKCLRASSFSKNWQNLPKQRWLGMLIIMQWSKPP